MVVAESMNRRARLSSSRRTGWPIDGKTWAAEFDARQHVVGVTLLQPPSAWADEVGRIAPEETGLAVALLLRTATG